MVNVLFDANILIDQTLGHEEPIAELAAHDFGGRGTHVHVPYDMQDGRVINVVAPLTATTKKPLTLASQRLLKFDR